MKLMVIFAGALIVLGLLLIFCSQGWSAEALYLNLDNKQWTIQGELFTTHDDCDKAARRAVREGKAFGAACAEFVPTRSQVAPQEWRGQPNSTYKSDRDKMIEQRRQTWEQERKDFEQRFYQPTPGMTRGGAW